MEISYTEWFSNYKPEANMLNLNAPFGGTMFETYGEEHDYIRSVLDESEDDSFIWTLVDGDSLNAIISGYHIVNRLGYFVTRFPAIGYIEVGD